MADERPTKRQREQSANPADAARRGLVALNRLDYVLQPDLSVCVWRTDMQHFFQQNTYIPGQRSISIWNSGACYIDPQNSYLRFSVKNASALWGFNFGVGSAMNLIKQIIITTRSGDELERIDQIGRLNNSLDRYMHSEQWLKTHGQMLGYGALVAPTSVLFEGTMNFTIPLTNLAGIFRSFDRLLPSTLCSGLRIEIEWMNASDAVSTDVQLTNAGAGAPAPAAQAPSFTIEDPVFVLDSYALTDAVQRVMNEESATRGLELVYSSWYHFNTTPSTAKINIEVRKAVSRALGVLTMLSPQSKAINRNDADLFANKPMNVTNYQLRLGSLYFPQQPIKSIQTLGDFNVPAAEVGYCLDTIQELYHHTMQGLGKIKTPSAETGVQPWSFVENSAWQAPDASVYTGTGVIGGQFVPAGGTRKIIRGSIDVGYYSPQGQTVLDWVDAATNIVVPIPRIQPSGNHHSYLTDLGIIYTDLERSSVQRLTGIPVNNSRVAEVQLELRSLNYPAPTATTHIANWQPYNSSAKYTAGKIDVHCWLNYCRLARVFLQNVEIEE